MRKETIKAMGYYVQRDDKSKLFLKRTYHKTYTSERVNYYFGWQHVLFKNSPTSISLLMYLAEKMDDFTNEVAHSKTTIRKYIEFRKSIGMTTCSDAAVKKGFQQLKKNNILIQTPETGNYIVNPRYLYKGTEAERRRYINTLLEYTKRDAWVNSNIFKALGLQFKQ